MRASGPLDNEFHDQHLRRARSQGVQVGLAVSLYGISFGALSVVLGFSVWQTMVLSLLMFSGASQFAFIGVMASGGLPAAGAAIASAGLLGVRNALYALRLSSLIGPGFLPRALAAQLTVDESTAVAVAQTDQRSARHGFWTTALVLYAGWNIATLIGALAGDAIGDVRAWGLDAVAAAAFLALLWPRLSSREPMVVALVAAVITMVLFPFVAAGVPILVVSVVAIATAIYRHRVDPHPPERTEGRSA
jgi:predicted branched-subunit amino acid permease